MGAPSLVASGSSGGVAVGRDRDNQGAKYWTQVFHALNLVQFFDEFAIEVIFAV